VPRGARLKGRGRGRARRAAAAAARARRHALQMLGWGGGGWTVAGRGRRRAAAASVHAKARCARVDGSPRAGVERGATQDGRMRWTAPFNATINGMGAAALLRGLAENATTRPPVEACYASAHLQYTDATSR
jgi:hypothetical protein